MVFVDWHRISRYGSNCLRGFVENCSPFMITHALGYWIFAYLRRYGFDAVMMYC